MSRQLEADTETRQAKTDRSILLALHRDLEHMFHAAGFPLEGFSVKLNGYDYLMTLRAVHEGERVVCFVGADSLGRLFPKSCTELRADRLRWRANNF